MVLEAPDSRSPPAAGAGAAVHGHRLSTVVPGSVTGEAVDYELADGDLLHKLHYLRAAHYFRLGDGVRGLTTQALKEPMFPWLDMYFPVSGRLRRREDDGDGEAAAAGRPYVRCNDCGVRIVEATCDATVDEWLEALPAGELDRAKMVTYDKVIGPELFFSPLLYVQITKFKCGGLAIGFTWAHLIGDVPSAAACFNRWAELVSGGKPTAPILRDLDTKPASTPAAGDGVIAPPSVKLAADPVGDHWAVPTTHDMASFSVHVTEQQLMGLQLHTPAGHRRVGPFELVSALLWQAMAKIRGTEETTTVTVVKADASARSGRELSNEQRVGHVAAATSPAKTDVGELAALLADAPLDEAAAASAAAAAGADVVLYGANLTFVDITDVDVYGMLELRGQRPAHVEYAVDGVGDGGAAVVHRDAGRRGLTVTAVVRRGEAAGLRNALRFA